MPKGIEARWHPDVYRIDERTLRFQEAGRDARGPREEASGRLRQWDAVEDARPGSAGILPA